MHKSKMKVLVSWLLIFCILLLDFGNHIPFKPSINTASAADVVKTIKYTYNDSMAQIYWRMDGGTAPVPQPDLTTDKKFSVTLPPKKAGTAYKITGTISHDYIYSYEGSRFLHFICVEDNYYRDFVSSLDPGFYTINETVYDEQYKLQVYLLGYSNGSGAFYWEGATCANVKIDLTVEYIPLNENPTLTVTSPIDNQQFSPESDLSNIRVEGFVQDINNDTVMITAAIDGVTKSTSALNTSIAREYALNFDVIEDGITNGIHDLTVTAADDKGGTVIVKRKIKVTSRIYNNAYILVNNIEPVIYQTIYQDEEDDLKNAEAFKFTHDPYFYDNNTGMISDSGSWRDTPYYHFNKIGKYEAVYRVKDSPKSSISFDNYKLWSRESLSKINFYVHRAPVPVFTVKTSPAAPNYTLSITEDSYDADHQSQPGKGIYSREWRWKKTTDADWTPGQLPSVLPPGSDYLLQLRVRDIDGPWGFGVWSKWKEQPFTTKNTHLPPVAQFIIEPMQVSHAASALININDKSYSPNGYTPLTYEWTVTRKSTGALLYNNNNNIKPTSAQLKSWGLDSFDVRLRVKDSLGLWSAPYTQSYEVLNNIPKADFDAPAEVYRDTVITPKNNSIDGDGDALSYEWYATLNGTDYFIGSQAAPSFKVQDIIDAHNILSVKAVGEWSLKLKAVDKFNAGSTAVKNFKVLNNKPWAGVQVLSKGSYASGGYDADSADIGCLIYKWRLVKPDGSKVSWSTKNIAFSFDMEGMYHLEHWVIDQIGEASDVVELDIDASAPIIHADPESREWSKSDVSVNVSAEDSGGLYRIGYRWSASSDNPDSYTYLPEADVKGKFLYSFDTVLTASDKWYLHLIAEDMNGNITKLPLFFGEYKIDKAPPTGVFNPGSSSWTNQNIEVVFDPADALSGVGKWRYRISHDNGQTYGSWSSYIIGDTNESILLKTQGQHNIQAEVTDTAGNTAIVGSGIYRMDLTAPVILVSPQNATVLDYSLDADVSITDTGGSGVKEFRYVWTQSTAKPTAGWSNMVQGSNIKIPLTKAGGWYLHIEAWDNAGNYSYRNFGVYQLTLPKVEIDFKAVHRKPVFTGTIPAGEEVQMISASNASKGVKVTANVPIASTVLYLENQDGTFTKVADLVLASKTASGADSIYQYQIFNYTLPGTLEDGSYTFSVQANSSTGIQVAADSLIEVYTPIWEDYSSGGLSPILKPLGGVPDVINLSSSTTFEEVNAVAFTTSKYTDKVKVSIGSISFYLFSSGKVGADPDESTAASMLQFGAPYSKQYKVSKIVIDGDAYKKTWRFDFCAVENFPLVSEEKYQVSFIGFDTAGRWSSSNNKHGFNPQVKDSVALGYLLYDFRVVLVRDLYLESYYKDSLTGQYPDKPIYVNDMAVDMDSFSIAGIVPQGFSSLTKGYVFEFEIDSKNFNGDGDTVEIVPRFYTCTQGVPSVRSGEEVDVYWQNSRHEFFRAGEGGHGRWKKIVLTKNERKITSEHGAVWRGNYLLPGTAFAVPKGTSVGDAKKAFLENKYIHGDIVVNFEIKGYKAGVMRFDYNLRQWPKERTKIKAPYKIGDVIRYDWKKNSLRDFGTVRNR